MLKFIKNLLFGKQAEPVCTIKTTYTTVYPPNQPSEWEWMMEFRVGMLYDRKLIHLN